MLLPNELYPVLTEPYPAPAVGAATEPQPKQLIPFMKRPKVLLVDDNGDELVLAQRSLETQNCEVVSAKSVTDALKQIAMQRFDVLITDLHMPEPGDGFAVVTAMRHSQPEALTLVVSDFPDVQKAMNAILLQADEVVVKPFDAKRLGGLMDRRKLTALPSLKQAKEGAASILDRDLPVLMQSWLARVEQLSELVAIPLSASERSAYLPAMVKSISARLRGSREIEGVDIPSSAAVTHGQARYRQGYTAPMIVQESRLLQVSIFEAIKRNLDSVDFASILPDIMIIADEVDSQLRQAIASFLAMQREEVASALAMTANDPLSDQTRLMS